MADWTCQLVGLEKTMAALNAKILEQKELSERGLLKLGIGGSNKAKEVSPVKTGNLRSHWGAEKAEGSTPEHPLVKVGNNVEYAPDVEWGHSTPSGTEVPPQPMLRPAAEWMRQHAAEIIRSELRHGGAE